MSHVDHRNESVKLAQSDTVATSLFPFIFIMGSCAEIKQGDNESFEGFWSIASPEMLGKCKTGVSINPPQPDKKPEQKGIMTPGMVLGGWK